MNQGPLLQLEESTGPEHRVQRAMDRAGTVIIALMVTLIALGIAAIALLRVDIAVTVEGAIEPQDLVTVRSPADGLVAEVRALAGDEVDPGDVLLVLDGTGIERRRQDLRLRIAEQQLALRRATGAVPLDLMSASESERIAQARVERATAQARRRLAEQGAGATGDLDSLLAARVGNVSLDEAAADLRMARAEHRVAGIERSRRHADSLSLAEMRLTLDRSRAELTALGEDSDRLTLRAPADGMVFTDRLDALRGRFVRQGDALLEMGTPGAWRVFLLVGERQVKRVAAGQRVRLEYAAEDAVSAVTQEGVVVAVSVDPLSEAISTTPGASGATRPTVYRVEVTADQGAGGEWLRRGLTVRGRIITGRERLGTSILRRFGGYDG